MGHYRTIYGRGAFATADRVARRARHHWRAAIQFLGRAGGFVFRAHVHGPAGAVGRGADALPGHRLGPLLQRNRSSYRLVPASRHFSRPAGNPARRALRLPVGRGHRGRPDGRRERGSRRRRWLRQCDFRPPGVGRRWYSRQHHFHTLGWRAIRRTGGDARAFGPNVQLADRSGRRRAGIAVDRGSNWLADAVFRTEPRLRAGRRFRPCRHAQTTAGPDNHGHSPLVAPFERARLGAFAALGRLLGGLHRGGHHLSQLCADPIGRGAGTALPPRVPLSVRSCGSA